MEFFVEDFVYKVTYDPAYSNNEISSEEKITKPIRYFWLSLGVNT